MDSPLTRMKNKIIKMKRAKKNYVQVYMQLVQSPFRKTLKHSRSRKSLREAFINRSKAFNHPLVTQMVREAKAMSTLKNQVLEPKISDSMQDVVFQTFGRTRSQTSRHALLPGLKYSGREAVSVQEAIFEYNNLTADCAEDVSDYISLCKRGQKIENLSRKLKHLPSGIPEYRTGFEFKPTPPPSKTPDINFLQEKVDEEWHYYLAEQLT
ncbi:unnamed protein product [Auanema sp. JU1783]|nr:unnamed protein product [Auanema sp. JU1783]